MKMKFLNQFAATIKPTLFRFPATFLLSALITIFASYETFQTGTDENSFSFIIGKSLCWAFALSVFSRLALEKLLSSFKKKNIFLLISQIVCVGLAFFPGYNFCNHNSERFYLVYFGTISALLVICPYLLSFSQDKEKVIPNIICALMISFLLAFCVGFGLCVIALSVDKLIYNFNNENVYITLCFIASCFFFPCTFLSYTTKKNEDISIPKTFKVIVLYTLFTLYCILILVLYLYLIKTLVVRELPSGKINPFVSVATVLYLFFYLSLGNYKNKATSFFYIYGSIFLIVLILVQIIAFSIRISAYGFTPARVASLYYIIFSTIFCVLPLVKKGKYMQAVFPIFAFICILGSLTPLNILDSASRSQFSRITRILKKYDLYQNGKIIPAPAVDTILEKDKSEIVKAVWDLSDSRGKKPDFVSEVYTGYGIDTDKFKDTFGFPYSGDYNSEEELQSDEAYKFIHYSYKVDVPEEKPVNISGFSEMYYFKEESGYWYSGEWKNVTVKFGNNIKIDITDAILPLMKEKGSPCWNAAVDSTEPLIIKKDGFTLIIREMSMEKNIYRYSDHDSIDNYYRIIGYACR
ncbi:MAG: DUF4153 domain-containing protein [Treponema sp.]|uniref:DUF4153 domain-containing protein n=1 Tax=Treponema sp. TaxID=166 RepID=UPI0025F19EB2|nr:DUF4153 domain-containing protein [Treponema sp.]MBR0494994.1 DUF4153 domain-containing protein [Treponema sp.]